MCDSVDFLTGCAGPCSIIRTEFPPQPARQRLRRRKPSSTAPRRPMPSWVTLHRRRSMTNMVTTTTLSTYFHCRSCHVELIRFHLSGPNAASQSLNTWRGSGAYAGGVSNAKPFWQVAARAWIPMLVGTLFTSACVLSVQWGTKDRREAGQLAGQHANLSAHKSGDINQRIRQSRGDIRSGDRPKASRMWSDNASTPRPGAAA